MLVAFILIEQHRFKTNLSNSIFINDGEAYSANGWQISTALTNSIPDMSYISEMRGIHIADRSWGLERYYNDYVKKSIIAPHSDYHMGYITYFYSIIYAAYGYKPVFINFLNVILHLLAAIVIYKCVESFSDNKAAYISVLFFLLNPISFYYSSTKLQESLYIFIIYFSLYCFIMAASNIKNIWYAVFIFPMLAIIYGFLKTHYFVPVLISFVISTMIILFNKSKKVLAILIVIFYLFLGESKDAVITKTNHYISNALIDSVIHNKGYYNTGGKVYSLFIPDKDAQEYTIMDWVNYYLKGWYHMLSEPILSENNTGKFILFFPVKIIFLILCVFAIPGILIVMRYGHIEATVFICILLLLGSGIAISSGNVGTVLRHRDIITPTIFIFSSVFISRLRFI